MTTALLIIESSISGAMLLMMVLGIVFAALMPTIDRWDKRYFITLFSMLLAASIVLFTDVILWGRPGMLKMESVVWFSEFLLMSVLMWMSMIFLLHRCGESVKNILQKRRMPAFFFPLINKGFRRKRRKTKSRHPRRLCGRVQPPNQLHPYHFSIKVGVLSQTQSLAQRAGFCVYCRRKTICDAGIAKAVRRGC